MTDTLTLARLIKRWGELYLISYSGQLYHAERRCDGARVHEPDATNLEKAIEEDYRHGPRPRGYPPPAA